MNKEQRKAKKTAKARARRRSYIKEKNRIKVSTAKIAKARKQRSIDFHNQHKDKGGLPQLMKMRRNLMTQDEMAKHFGVVKETIRYWMAEIFDDSYDPRYERRENKIEKLVGILKKDGKEQFEKYCKEKKVHRLYKEEALKRFTSNKKKS